MSDNRDEVLDSGLPASRSAGVYGTTVSADAARLILLPVPWEATTSYGRGTARGPAAILRASHQLDLFDGAFGEFYKKAGIHMLPENPRLHGLNDHASVHAHNVIASFDEGAAPRQADLAAVNADSANVNRMIAEEARTWLGRGKLCGVVGGDHSSPYGLIAALAEQHSDGFDILHFDAHHDLREAYEGFTDSHASIMFNVLERIPQVKHLVQVGIRDYSRGEHDYALKSNGRVAVHYDRNLFAAKAAGRTFAAATAEILSGLGPRVYVSFDIDGLDPAHCPGTGTPVPGGLSFSEAMYILEALAVSGRSVVGFDLCEVAPSRDGSEWDANVGARVLYKLCGLALTQVRG